MMYKLLTVPEVCGLLRWGGTTYHERRAAGLFPKAFNISGSKKGNRYFEHEIKKYIECAISISSDYEFMSLARDIESSRQSLAA